jgi:hypothetical protein
MAVIRHDIIMPYHQRYTCLILLLHTYSKIGIENSDSMICPILSLIYVSFPPFFRNYFFLLMNLGSLFNLWHIGMIHWSLLGFVCSSVTSSGGKTFIDWSYYIDLLFLEGWREVIFIYLFIEILWNYNRNLRWEIMDNG